MEKEPAFYPDFDYPASQLSAFTFCIDVFIISLKNGKIVRFTPLEVAPFKEWLERFKVRDISVNDGIPYNDRTADLSKSSYGFLNLIKRNKRK